MDKVLKLLKETGALTEGHFLLSSGKHSGNYCQCAKLLRFPQKAAEALSAVARQVEGLKLTKVCGPAMGGVIVSYELSRQLNLESIFTERENEEMKLRRGFNVQKGDRVLIAEDVVTTGKSTMETVRVLENSGAEVVGVACIVDRRNADCELKLPLYAAIKLDFSAYEPAQCPFCQKGIPIDKPGSRKKF